MSQSTLVTLLAFFAVFWCVANAQIENADSLNADMLSAYLAWPGEIKRFAYLASLCEKCEEQRQQIMAMWPQVKRPYMRFGKRAAPPLPQQHDGEATTKNKAAANEHALDFDYPPMRYASTLLFPFQR